MELQGQGGILRLRIPSICVNYKDCLPESMGNEHLHKVLLLCLAGYSTPGKDIVVLLATQAIACSHIATVRGTR